MKLLKYILLINTVLVVQVVATRTLAQEVKKDSVIPSQKDAIALAQSVCGASNVNQEKGKLSCKVCPSFTGSSGGSGGTLTSVVYGRFTKADTHEALVDLGDCEPHAGNWGGTVLLRRTNNGWSRVRYESGFRSNICLKIPNRTGRHSLACQGSYTGQGYLTEWLDAIVVGSTKTTTTNLLKVGSNTGSCSPPYYEVQIKDFLAQDTNKDGLTDLVVKVSEAREAKSISRGNGEGCVDSRLPKPKFHQLTFLSNRESFRPTSTTANLMKHLEVK
ncbi:hypothetical protein H6G41_34070 [Tolypothrix sp. FACHB-123]|uniref:hypothetical protein n=1 Tax=Tolypothrix sp. FACHB-123 TaxID=2692868 RepID=UPI001687C287|nr:hypothetical protein [Tolypothrix sp. FACHB-123]MBD2359513.1 hypothetical protein [Tolypothrix sp. FACHB-123]